MKRRTANPSIDCCMCAFVSFSVLASSTLTLTHKHAQKRMLLDKASCVRFQAIIATFLLLLLVQTNDDLRRVPMNFEYDLPIDRIAARNR